MSNDNFLVHSSLVCRSSYIGSFVAWFRVEIFALGSFLIKSNLRYCQLTLHMVAGHSFDVSKSLLSGSDQLRSALL